MSNNKIRLDESQSVPSITDDKKYINDIICRLLLSTNIKLKTLSPSTDQ